jgi:hypothetical protein
MALVVTHTTPADGTFSTAGATAWNANHTLVGTIDLVTETTGSIDLTARSTGTINLLTQTRGATANQVMYGGASGQVAQSSKLQWDATNQKLTIADAVSINSNEFRRLSPGELIFIGYTPGSGNGGGLSFSAGQAYGSGGGGGCGFTAGAGAGAFPGGAFAMAGGDGSFTSALSSGGGVDFFGGFTYGASGSGGTVNFVAGSAYSNSAPGGIGGDVALTSGDATGNTGSPGNIRLILGSDIYSGVGKLDISSTFGWDVALAPDSSLTHTKDLPVTVDGVQRYIRLYS